MCAADCEHQSRQDRDQDNLGPRSIKYQYCCAILTLSIVNKWRKQQVIFIGHGLNSDGIISNMLQNLEVLFAFPLPHDTSGFPI